MNKRLLIIATLAVCFSSGTFATELVPLEHFVKLPEYREPKISPTGEFVGVIAPVDGQDSLVIIRLSEMQIESVLRFAVRGEVLDFYWVNDDRIVCSFGQTIAGKGVVRYSAGEIYAMDADGKKKKSIFGYRSGLDSRVDSRIKEAKPIRAAGFVIDPLQDDRSYILIASYPFAGTTLADVGPTIFKLHVYTGARKKQDPVPYRSFNYITDRRGEIRAANYIDRDRDTAVLYRDGNELGVVNKLSAPYADVRLLEMDAKGERIYFAESRDGKPRGVSLYDPKTGSVEDIWSHDSYDVLDLVWSADKTNVIGATYYADKLSYAFFDKKNPDARLIMSVQRAFDGKEIEVVSRTRDGKKSVIRVGSGSEPSEYYMFDAEKRNMNYLLGTQPWVDPKTMSPVSHFVMEARDGQKLHGYVTIPVNSEGKNLPFVVMPHGGPHGIRDDFSFDPEVQVLASRGYGVLQVNYRGSWGYGTAFQEAGYRKWGTAIQDDIADAAQWSIDEGYADGRRMCIVGASFGGYSAIMSAVRFPELYQCAVGELGVYDLPLMYEEGDIPDRNMGVDYLQMAIGTDEEELVRQSPSRNVESINANLLIIYGKHDERAPPAQSIALTRELDRIGKPYELFVMRDEGHSFFSEPTRLEHYTRILRFIERNIGPGATKH